MQPHIDDKNLEKLIEGIRIPPCPQIMLDLVSELRKPEPDFLKVASLIQNDPAHAALVLKLANSPLFVRSARLGSIREAVASLGMQNVLHIVSNVSLRNSIQTENPAERRMLEKFWDKAAHTAEAALLFAAALPGMSRDDAYTCGLFHDCGIPILSLHFERYLQVCDVSDSNWESILSCEESHFGTNHAVVAYFFACNWKLPPHISQAILLHHDGTIFDRSAGTVDETVRNLVALTVLAKHITAILLNEPSHAGWTQTKLHALEQLGLVREEFKDIALDILGELRERM